MGFVQALNEFRPWLRFSWSTRMRTKILSPSKSLNNHFRSEPFFFQQWSGQHNTHLGRTVFPLRLLGLARQSLFASPWQLLREIQHFLTTTHAGVIVGQWSDMALQLVQYGFEQEARAVAGPTSHVRVGTLQDSHCLAHNARLPRGSWSIHKEWRDGVIRPPQKIQKLADLIPAGRNLQSFCQLSICSKSTQIGSNGSYRYVLNKETRWYSLVCQPAVGT